VVERIGRDFWYNIGFSSGSLQQSECYSSCEESYVSQEDKHIDVRYHKLCQWVVDDKMIDLVKINTKKNSTDMMTKAIPVEKFRASLNFIKVL